MALRDFDIIQTFELRNNLKLPLHFKLETCLPFVVLKPASPRPCTRSSCTPHAEDGPYLSLQPQQRTLVRLLFCSYFMLKIFPIVLKVKKIYIYCEWEKMTG